MPPSWDFVRGPAGVAMLVDAAAAHGVGAEACLRGSGLRPADLADPAARVQAGQELAVARTVLALVGDRPGLGVAAGRTMTLGTFGVWIFAFITSPTLGDAVDLAVRYWRLSSAFVALEVERAGGDVRVRFGDEEIPEDVRGLLVERDLACVLTLAGLAWGPQQTQPRRLETRLTGARLAALQAASPGFHVAGGQPGNALVVDAASLAERNAQADEATRRACELECVRLLEARTRRAGMAARVRGLLLERPEAPPSADAVAATLSVDVRTLRRHLTAEGTSYRALRQEVAMTMAHELLSTVGLSVGEVAARVGYRDATAFSHAFRRTFGRPPSAVRTGGARTAASDRLGA